MITICLHGLRTIQKCANALATIGRGEFIQALDEVASPPSVLAIKKVILPRIKERNHLSPGAQAIFDRLVRELLPDVVGPLLKQPIKAGDSSRAMLHQNQVPTRNFNPAAAAAANGGIDLNQIKVSRTGKTIVQFDPAQLNELMQGDFEGFAPVIISITTIQSPLPLLGISPDISRR